jgi:hypothetical protein
MVRQVYENHRPGVANVDVNSSEIVPARCLVFSIQPHVLWTFGTGVKEWPVER